MAAGRGSHTASVLPSGKVLVAGGSSGGGYLASAELYDPAGNAGAGSFAATGPLAAARTAHTATVLLSGKVLIAAGYKSTFVGSAELYGGEVGDACVANGSCFAGFCADGFCCDAACGGGCDRCDVTGKEGTCSLAPSGSPGANATCGAFVCDGVNAACPTSCAFDVACAAGYYCSADGSCQPRKAQAAACNVQSDCKQPGCRECTSGFCVDGVCCDKACAGTCQACVAKLKQSGVGDGFCDVIKDGLDPRNECTPDGTPCGADGQCNGAGACRVSTPDGTSCSADGKVCNASGACVVPAKAATCDGDHTTTSADGTTQDCAPYKCDSNGTCRPPSCASVNDCVAPTICDSAGKCVSPTDAAGGDGGGCSVSTSVHAQPRDATSLAFAVAGALAAFARRRRRRAGQMSSSIGV
jgi:hypothetical protein